MDTATLLDLRSEPLKKPQSLAAKASASSNAAAKSEQSFKSAYKEQLKAERNKEQEKEKSLPQNGNELPDREKDRLETEKQAAEDKAQTEQTTVEQVTDESKTETAAYQQEQQTNNNTDKLSVEEEGALPEVDVDPAVIAGQLSQEKTPDPLLETIPDQTVPGQRKAGPNLSTVKNTDVPVSGIINALQDAVKKRPSEEPLAIKSAIKDSSTNRKDTATGSAIAKSIIDFQQYMESSRTQTLTAQPIASVKNFENIINAEQLNGQTLQTEKSALTNQNLNSAVTANTHSLSNAAAISNSLGFSPNGVVLEVKPGVGKPGWSQAFNHQIMIMAGNGVQQAKLKLNPLHLGPVEVSIKLTKDKAFINLSSVQLSTRDAIDGAIPRLKEMLNENGFSQVDVNVSHQDKQEQQEAALFNSSSSQERSNNEHGNSTMPGDEQLSELGDGSENGSLLSKKLAQSLNIVDYYA